MKFSSCNKLIVFFLSLCISIPHIQSSTTAPSDLRIEPISLDNELLQAAFIDNTLKKEACEILLNNALDHLTRFDRMLEDLAFVVSEDTVKTRNKKIQIENIKEIRKLLEALKNDSYLEINEQMLHALVHFTRALVSHVSHSLNCGFYELPLFDITQISIPQEGLITLEALEKELVANENFIKTCEKKSSNAGLHWYNKLYRVLKYRVAQPAQKYKLNHLATNLLCSAAFTGYLFWQFGGDNPLSNFLRDKVGWPAKTDKFGNLVNDDKDINHTIEQLVESKDLKLDLNENPINRLFNQVKSDFDQPMGWLGSIEYKKYLMTVGMMPIGTYLFNSTKDRWASLFPSYGIWLRKKGKAIDNFLMGGVYRKESVEGVAHTSTVNFSDMIGNEMAKEWGRMICNYLKNAEPLDRAKLTPPKGCLLVGPTRTGKSFFVSCLLGEIIESIGNEAGFRLLTITHKIVEQFGFEAIAMEARSIAPCILFFDEIDLLGLQRSTNPQRLSEFLIHMSGCFSSNEPGKEVIILAATNKPENLDKALRQPGRFSQEIYFEYPGLAERITFLEKEFNKRAINIDNIDIGKIARETEGYSYEALGFLVKKALLRVKIYNETFNQELLEESLDENLRGITTQENTIPEDQKKLLATHQAGHAVASVLLNSHKKLSKVTIKEVKTRIKEQHVCADLFANDEQEKTQSTEYGKMFVNHEQDELDIEDRAEKIKQCKIILAGHIAEEILLGECGYGYHREDTQKALKVVQSIVFEGLEMDKLPNHIQKTYFDQSFALLKDCKDKTRRLLENNKEALTNVANALQEHQTLDAQQVTALINGDTSCMQKKTKNNNEELNEILKGLLSDQDAPECIKQ